MNTPDAVREPDAEAQMVRGQLLNDQGYRARTEGRFDLALELFEDSLAVCEQVADWDGAVVALENRYLTFHAAARYPDALAELRRIFPALARAQSFDKLANYAHELQHSVESLSRLGRVCVVRRSHLDADLRRCAADAGAEILLVEDGQDVLEVLAYATPDERAALLADFSRALGLEGGISYE
jgi:hypothetical protein